MGDGTGCDNMTCIVVTFSKNAKPNKRPRSPVAAEEADTEVGSSGEQPAKVAKIHDDETEGNEAAV